MTGSEVTPVLERDDFIRDAVWRRLGERTEPPEVELIRHRRGILEYRFADGHRVFAKPFTDPDKTLAAYEIQRALWEGGLGSGVGVPRPGADRIPARRARDPHGSGVRRSGAGARDTRLDDMGERSGGRRPLARRSARLAAPARTARRRGSTSMRPGILQTSQSRRTKASARTRCS